MTKRVLVVEDEIHIQRLVQIVLEKSGIEVTVKSDGEAALALLEEDQNFELILLDIMMPGMDGLQVLRTLKQSSKTKHIDVVMLTALAQEDVVLEGVKLGATDYIRKPFHPRELVERIERRSA